MTFTGDEEYEVHANLHAMMFPGCTCATCTYARGRFDEIRNDRFADESQVLYNEEMKTRNHFEEDEE